MKLSARGIALIARFEGFRSRPYRDAVGVWTIGYGSTRGVGPSTPPISESAARARMTREVEATYGAAVNRLPGPLTQAQFDALTSFVYNVGPGGISPATRVGRSLRAQKYRDAADALLEWNKGGGRVLQGLVNRRRAERELFLSESEPSDPLTKRERRLVNELEAIRRGHGRVWNVAEKARAEAIKAWMVDQRRRLVAAGWTPERRARYRLLGGAVRG